MQLEFHFDFGSPNCFFAHRALPAIEAKHGVRFVRKPILLGGLFKLTGNQPPMVAFAGVKGKIDYARQEIIRFQKRHGITDFVWNANFPINTITLMRGATYAQDKPWYDAYLEACYRGMWSENLNMGEAGVFDEVLSAAGLPASEIVGGAQDPAVKQALIDATQASADRGNFGAPTFFVGDEMFFGKDSLWEVEEALAAS